MTVNSSCAEVACSAPRTYPASSIFFALLRLAALGMGRVAMPRKRPAIDGGLCAGGESDVTWRMDRKENGSNFQIIVDGKTRSYRDVRETALEAGMFLKERHPQSEVVVRDVLNDVRTVIGWNNGSAYSCDVISPAALN
jgi:hypothetical protein